MATFWYIIEISLGLVLALGSGHGKHLAPAASSEYRVPSIDAFFYVVFLITGAVSKIAFVQYFGAETLLPSIQDEDLIHQLEMTSLKIFKLSHCWFVLAKAPNKYAPMTARSSRPRGPCGYRTHGNKTIIRLPDPVTRSGKSPDPWKRLFSLELYAS